MLSSTLFSVALITGFVGSLHCVGMCGPIAVALPIGGMSPLKALMARMSYHVGRLSAYMSLGYVFGYFGWGVRWAGMQQWLSIAIGLMMLTLVFFQHNLGISAMQGLWGKLKKTASKVIQQKSLVGFGTLGLLNGYLPCGILYIALAGAAATSTPFQGSLYMLMYGLGTVPALLLVSYLPHLLKGTFRLKFQKIVPIYTFVLAIFFVVRGLNLGIPYLSPHFDKNPESKEIPICHGQSMNK